MPKQDVFRANVSSLHLCHRCPRLFAFERNGKKDTWKVGFEGTFNCGTAFHKSIATPFHKDASGQNGMEKRHKILDLIKNNSDNPETLKKELLFHVCQDYFSSFLKKTKKRDTTHRDSLNKCIEKWVDFLVDDFLFSNSGFLNNPKTFTEQAFWRAEKIMETDYADSDGTTLTISGQCDCILLDRTREEKLLVEFKCRRKTDSAEEFVQLALYAKLIRKYSGLLPRACVLYLEEENPLKNYSATETEKMIELLPRLFNTAIQVIRAVKSNKESIPKTDNPSLCKKCPYHKDCDTRFGS